MTAIVRRPSMSARYWVTSDLPAAQRRAAVSRCGGGPRPSQKDTGRTGRLSQKEREARGALLAKRVFVENRSSEIQITDGVDDISDQLCNIRSTIGARANNACAMVTVELQRNPHVANADTLDRADVPEPPGLVSGGALAARDDGNNRQVNHADAPQDAVRRFGTDLAPWVLREFCAC